MVRAIDLGDIPPNYVFSAVNMIPRGGSYWRRPTFQNSALITSGTTANMQGFFVLRLPSGEVKFAIYAGEIYGTAAGGSSFSKLVSTANLSTASITLSGTALVYGAQYGAVFVLNDGTNQPFTWDGSSGAGGLTKLTNAPSACFGAPTVYYGKLFFIKGSDQRTLVWSEENAANTGYEATGYSNAWTLTQMGTGPLYVIIGLNDGLYYFRRSSIGVIRGAVTPDFSAAGVHDNVALGLGAISPKAVAYYNGYLWFLDSTNHPQRIAVGTYQIEPIWHSIAADFFEHGEITVSTTDATLYESAVLPVPTLGGVWFLMNTTSVVTRGTVTSASYLFNGSTGDCWCNIQINTNTSGNTPISGTGLVAGAVQTVGANQGVGIVVGTTGAVSGWTHLTWPAYGTTAYDATWPDAATMRFDLISAPLGDVGGMARWLFSEARLRFVIGSVPTGTETQAIGLWVLPPSGSVSVSTQNIANTGNFSEREYLTRTWGLASEASFLQIGPKFTSTPVPLPWGVAQMDLLAYEVPASPAWSTT